LLSSFIIASQTIASTPEGSAVTAAPSAITAPSTVNANVSADVDDELAAVVQAQLALMQAQPGCLLARM
jgi:hypothetical protein